MIVGWSEIRATFPADVMAAQSRVLELVRAGNFVPFRWVEVQVIDSVGNRARFSVAGAPLRIGTPGDSVYMSVSHATAQTIADWLGWSTMTPLLMDQTVRAAQKKGAYVNATPLTAGFLWGIKGAPTDTQHMVEHSQAVDKAAAGATLVAGPWKGWVSSARFRAGAQPPLVLGQKSAMQYGAFDITNAALSRSVTGDMGLWQTPGSTHPTFYADYIEKFRPVNRWVVVELVGQAPYVEDIYVLAADPKLAHLVNHDGPLNMHHPFLPVCAPLDDGGACGGTPAGGGGTPKPGPVPPGGTLIASRFAWPRLIPLGIATALAVTWVYVVEV